MRFDEEAIACPCAGLPLAGILARPREAAARGVLIVVGGPQYRVGSHRQFTLLARHLATLGYASLRFDYRGMGDSAGDPRGFEDVAQDIRAAVDEMFHRVPALTEIALCGLCDAASAAIFYAPGDPRVTGMVLLNPWVRTGEGRAKAYLKHYYLARLADREFWRKLAAGEFRILDSARSLIAMLAGAWGRGRAAESPDAGPDWRGGADAAGTVPLPERMRAQFERFRGRTLLILSGNDLTAAEFRDAVRASRGWRRLLASPRVACRDLPDANHTFSTRAWRDQVAQWTGEWMSAQ